MKGNVIRLNIMHLNSVHLNSIGEVQSVSLKAGESTEDPVYPPTTYTLAANVSNGKVTATKNGTAISLPYVATEGDVIVLSVTPDEGYEFNGWLDGNKSNPRTVTMNKNIVLSASCVEIAKPTYTLSASVTNGMVSAKRNGSAVTLPFTANEGDVIVLSVTPNDGYEFNGWNDGNTDNPRTITMNADVALSAECSEVVQPPVGNYIQFEDKNVEAICVANWSSDGIGLTEEDAAKVTSLGAVFNGNKEITSFNELRYFTGVSRLGTQSWSRDTAPFDKCTSLQSIKLPPSVTAINYYAFYGCSSLNSINLDHVETLWHCAFLDCTALSMDIIAPKLTGSVGAGAINNTSITKVLDLGTVTNIDGGWGGADGALRNNALLTCVILPPTLTSIGIAVFADCPKLKTFISKAVVPPALGASQFDRTPVSAIYVPDASLEAYKTATNWSAYSSKIKGTSQLATDEPTLYAEIQQYL